MEYHEFTLSQLREAFELTIEEPNHLFSYCLPIAPSEHLCLTLDENLALAIALNTEKARSELVITPVLLEVRRQM